MSLRATPKGNDSMESTVSSVASSQASMPGTILTVAKVLFVVIVGGIACAVSSILFGLYAGYRWIVTSAGKVE